MTRIGDYTHEEGKSLLLQQNSDTGGRDYTVIKFLGETAQKVVNFLRGCGFFTNTGRWKELQAALKNNLELYKIEREEHLKSEIEREEHLQSEIEREEHLQSEEVSKKIKSPEGMAPNTSESEELQQKRQAFVESRKLIAQKFKEQFDPINVALRDFRIRQDNRKPTGKWSLKDAHEFAMVLQSEHNKNTTDQLKSEIVATFNELRESVFNRVEAARTDEIFDDREVEAVGEVVGELDRFKNPQHLITQLDTSVPKLISLLTDAGFEPNDNEAALMRQLGSSIDQLQRLQVIVAKTKLGKYRNL